MCEYCHGNGLGGHLAGCPNRVPKTVCYCEHCADPIAEGDEVWQYRGVMYHPECFEQIALELLEDAGAKKVNAEE